MKGGGICSVLSERLTLIPLQDKNKHDYTGNLETQ